MTSSLLTAAEVAKQLGVPTSWVYEQSRRGLIPTVTLGRYRRYRRGAIEQWLGGWKRSTTEGALIAPPGLHAPWRPAEIAASFGAELPRAEPGTGTGDEPTLLRLRLAVRPPRCPWRRVLVRQVVRGRAPSPA